MTPQLLARVRWNNVGIALLVGAVVVLVVVWPRLGAAAPELPRDAPVRSVATPPMAVSEDAMAPPAQRPVRRVVRKRRHSTGPERRVGRDVASRNVNRRSGLRRRRVAANPRPVAPAPPPAPPPAPVYVAPAPPVAQAEFGIEGP